MDNQTLLRALGKEATLIDEVMRSDLAHACDPDLYKVLSHALFKGGKRIRPLLTLLSARLVAAAKGLTEQGEKNLYRLATVFEYLHAASLLHDDVIDNASHRRGQPSANIIWGVNLSILAGDWLHARAMRIAGAAGGRECVEMIGLATEAMTAAEFLQRRIAHRGDLSEEAYFQVLNGKTAALIATSCETGAFVAGGMEKELAAMRLYGNNLGVAFQIVDDLLDYQGDPARTGKAVGNDLSEGKMTLPLIIAMAEGDDETKNALRAVLKKSPNERKHDLLLATSLIEKAGGFQRAREKAVQFIGEAQAALLLFPSDSSAGEILHALAEYVLARHQ